MRAPWPVKLLIGVVGPCLTIGLPLFLFKECSHGSEVIDAYVATIRAGAAVTPQVGGAEADALTKILRETTSVTVYNFLSQADSSCYYARLSRPEGSISASFLMDEGESGPHVVGATVSRDCTCPEDAELRCHLD